MQPFRIQRILFATDFLANSRLAFDYSVALAHQFHAKLVILHAVELPGPAQEAEALTHLPSVSRENAERCLREFAQSVEHTGIQVETRVENGIPSEVIRRVLQEGFDLLAIGVHGMHRGLAHLLVGSNTEKILLSTPCPTLTVGAHVLGGVGLQLRVRRILYFSDFTRDAATAVPFARSLASAYSANLETYHVLPHDALQDSRKQQQIAKEYCDQLHKLLPDAEPTWFDPQCQIERGMAMQEVLNRAQSERDVLIVTGVHRESFMERHLESSFAYQLIATATGPVVTVSPGTG